MRPTPNQKRPRGRGGNGRRPTTNRNQTFDSNGPNVRIRGNAYQVMEKYLTLARDATSSGDRVMAENYYQHAEHYYRVVKSTTDPQPAQRPGPGGPNGTPVNGYQRPEDDASPSEQWSEAEGELPAEAPPDPGSAPQPLEAPPPDQRRPRSRSGRADEEQPAAADDKLAPEAEPVVAAEDEQSPARPRRGRPRRQVAREEGASSDAQPTPSDDTEPVPVG